MTPGIVLAGVAGKLARSDERGGATTEGYERGRVEAICGAFSSDDDMIRNKLMINNEIENRDSHRTDST